MRARSGYPLDLLICNKSIFDKKKNDHTVEHIISTKGIKIYG
jgi:hypothetical protein